MRESVLSRALRGGFAAGAVGWAASLPLASWAAAHAALWPAASPAALLVYLAGGVVCHQQPLRSFHLWGVQMPVCARCTGVYIGAAAMIVWRLGLTRVARHAVRVGWWTRDARAARVAVAAAVAPTVVTLLVEIAMGRPPANWIRAIAGVPLGAVIAALVLGATGSTDRPAATFAEARPAAGPTPAGGDAVP
jgi:uncharacterized membrane protein